MRKGESSWERAWQLDLEPGLLVEVTFEDGSLPMEITEKFNGAVYHCKVLNGGAGCTVKPSQIRVLSALEIFNLGVNNDRELK